MFPPTHPDPETDVAVLDRYWLWRGESSGLTMFGAYIGRVLLTNRRLLFLSSGSNGILQQLWTKTPPATDHLDHQALHNRGSLNLPLEHIVFSAVARRRDFASFLLVRTKTLAFSFMSKSGFDRERVEEFQALLEEHRAAIA